MKTSSGSNAAIWKAYPDSQVDLWDRNLVNGEYVIAFEINPGLGQSLQNLLPAVSDMALKRRQLSTFFSTVTSTTSSSRNEKTNIQTKNI